MNRAQARRMAFTEFDGGKTVKGKYLWKKRWYSICSTHQIYSKDCPRCNIGSWHSDWKQSITSWFFHNFPKFWIWWVNNI